MPLIELSTPIRAPVERCSDLARSIDFHLVTADKTQEKAIRGRTSGLIELGEEVTWRARHLGLWQELTGKITLFDRPRHFQDVMTRGAFASMRHDHYFEKQGGKAIMLDRFAFKSPLGPLGILVDHFFLERYMRRFLAERARVLKAVAESDDWQQFLEH